MIARALPLVAALTLGCVAGAAQANEELPAIAQIVSRGEVRVAMLNQDIAPMVSAGENGEPTGIDVEIAKVVAQAIGTKLTIVRTADTFDAVIDQVANGDADLGISYLTRTVERARKVRFTEPYLTQSLGLLVSRVHAARQEAACPSENALAPYLMTGTTGVTQSSAYDRRLAGVAPQAGTKRYDNVGAMMDALRSGDIDMTFQGEIVALNYLNENPSMRVYALLCHLPVWQETIAIAVSPQHEGLVPVLDVLLDYVTITIADDGEATLHVRPWTY